MTQDKPLISVIMLCYNQLQFVAEAIDGVLDQTYSPLEIVIVDDCSSDGTAEVIAAHIAKRGCENSVTFIRNPRNLSGRISCINGLNMTSGSFVLQTCGDDVMMPEMIAEMANVWLSENVSLVTTNAIYIDESSRPLNRTFRDPNIPADDSFETLARDGSNACCFGAAIGFERELYAKFGWPPAYLGAYDIMLPFYACLLKGARFISSPLLKYRVHRGNTSLSLRSETASSWEKAAFEERDYLVHLAHAVLMEEEITRLRAEVPERYGPIADQILPLLGIQMAEMSKKLVRISRNSGTLARHGQH
jgi:glycosyltransferase involved in cell wall biosynthesis